ncbi:ATP-binding cassette domain-containing protein [Euzebya sp.]|uniref:ATP-binding cassette domain-containing protein n=1 Tax=Euzebya sp. TaxID=1971409 RepID=UPI003516CBA5
MMITARALSRTFRPARSEEVEAVRGIDLDVDDGELVAVLGPNGAGKTTLIRMLTTLLRPSGGTATVVGQDVRTEPAAVRRRIGYVGQGNAAGLYQRVDDELMSQCRAYGLRGSDGRRRVAELADAFSLGALLTRKGQTLSGGQRRRVDVAMGLVHHPSLLFLDEPSTGLDPQSRANLWGHIAEVRRASGMTILLTTHYLEEADLMAERVVVVDDGQVIADDAPARLKADLAGDRITVGLSSPDDVDAAATLGRELAGDGTCAVDGTELSLRATAGDEVLAGFLQHLARRGIEVARAVVERPTLDDVFLSLSGRSLREETIGTAEVEEVAA